jgi:type VI secretion system protein ImpK
MSRGDDPFERGGKTVIRPNPGGGGAGSPQNPGGQPPGIRQPQQPQWPAQGQPPGGYPPQQPGGWPQQPPGGYPQQGGRPQPGGGGYNPRVNAPQQGFGPGVGGMPSQQDDWYSSPSQQQPQFPQYGQQQPPPPSQPKIPLAVALNARDSGQIPAANPLTAAAGPLLILLGRLRLMIIDVEARPLMEHVANEIVAFEQRAIQAGVDKHDVDVGKYVLAGTADDIVQNLPGADKGVWLQYSMVAQFFGRRTSGVGFYDELAKVLQAPGARYNLLELMHACLSLGFEGQYRGSANGANELARIRRTVYETLRHLKQRNDEDISPRWRGLELKMRDLTSRVPMWAIGALAAVLLVGVFFALRFLLGTNVDLLADRLVALHPSSAVALERTEFAPPVTQILVDQTQLERIRSALAPEIEAGGVSADIVGDLIIISVSNVLLFDSGKATVKPEFEPLAAAIAKALDPEPGPINVVGHTDNVKPSSTARFKSNFDLSVARAQSVADQIGPLVTDQTRIAVEGKGDLEPITDNSTPELRAQNRRVEISIPREETLQ